MPYVDYDQNLQPVKLSHENTLRHKALVLRNNKTDFTRPESYEFDRFAWILLRKDNLDCKTMVERRNQCCKAK